MKNVDLLIIGGGPAGMTAAVKAYKEGLKNILIIERDSSLGGILQQCIHNGFGLHKFNEELTGPEYAYKYEKIIYESNIPYLLDTTVIDISENKVVTAINENDGIFQINAKAIILAMGCRERPKGALNIAGSRPAGIYSAGTAQKLVNIKGYMPGKNIVILGSGDIGLIMARRMTLEGASVKAVCEIMPYSSGLQRNIEQCLNDFDIPLFLSSTIIKIHGKDRVEGVTIAKVDKSRKPILGTEKYIPCDTVLLSVGLIPDNVLSKSANIMLSNITNGPVVDQNRQTSINGIFACGNVLHVHDLVDNVSDEAEIAAMGAINYINNQSASNKSNIKITTDGKVRYTVPQTITEKTNTKVYFRVSDIFTNVNIVIKCNNEILLSKFKEKLTPGEMESIIIPEKYLQYYNNDELLISLEESN